MRTIILAAFLCLGLAACNPVPPLTNAEKAKYMYELVEETHNCDGFRHRLDVPGVDGPALEAIYREAIKGGCIKRDV